MRRIALLLAMFALALAGVGAALADNPHPPGCKGDPHKCATTTNPYTDTVTQTVTVPSTVPSITTLPAVTVPGPSSTITTLLGVTDHVVTILVPPTPKPTLYRVKVKVVRKIVRRWCSRQRHGWRCYAKRPPYPPHGAKPLPKRTLS